MTVDEQIAHSFGQLANGVPPPLPYACSVVGCHATENLVVCPIMTHDKVTLVCRSCVMDRWYEGNETLQRCDGGCGFEHKHKMEGLWR